MIVIEGRAGKSRVLVDLINNQMRNRSVVVIDTIPIPSLYFAEGVEHLIFDDLPTEDIPQFFEDHYSQFKKYDWVVFEVNADILKIDLHWFKELDRKFPQNFIITVQSHLDKVEVYYA